MSTKLTISFIPSTRSTRVPLMISDHYRTPGPPLGLVAITSTFPEIFFSLYIDGPPHDGPGYRVECPGDIVIRVEPLSTYCGDECDDHSP